jgi:uncharacterized protein YbaA (DUF1428 family)
MDSSPPCPPPTARRIARHAAEAAKVFKENGALAVVECWGDDVPDGNLTSFPMAVKRQPDETVVSRGSRDLAGSRHAWCRVARLPA